jgi:hypothetical protein
MKERKIIMSNDLVSTFDGREGNRNRGPFAKFSSDNANLWTATDGTVFTDADRFLATGTDKFLQRFEEGIPKIEQPKSGELLQDTADDLNKKIPQDQWPIGLNRQPEPPWKPTYAVYLLRVRDAAMYTASNSTVGHRIAVHNLTDRVKIMQKLRGDVLPVVTLSAKPMKTKFGLKQRPHFEIVEWQTFGGGDGGGKVIEHKPSDGGVAAIGKPVKEPTLAEELDDDLPDHLKK